MSVVGGKEFLLDGKRILITGAAGALGREVTAVAESLGAKTVLVDLAFPEGFREDSEKHIVNLSDAAAVNAVLGNLNDIDAVFNIAGGFNMGPTVYETTSEDWDGLFTLNVKTAKHVIDVMVPKMIARGKGAVVNVGAYGALTGQANMSAYCGSKGVVMKMTESLADEVRDKGVNVNAVLPTIIDTPANRAAMPDADFEQWVAPADLGRVMCFLASDAAKAIHGALLPVRGLS